ncbi:hypothetical protein HK103_005125 [Boothiomyces macroporosus]|uniref:Apple domain-containing protein n=1 Tax=Boothiomyces macroporosus TaxID=261099 RepID=A0AAD5UG52_9FUNG|nr:hypothetical protein HK103_005125 [Boothiomyces macroporosus]
MTTYYNGIPFTQSGDLYTSSNCQINSAYFQVSNCTSLNDCASLCTLAKQPFTTLANSQNNYMCAAFTYDPHVQGCFLYDRSISTLSVISNSMYCGFILTNNRYCTDNSQRINCNTPDLSSKSVNSQTTAYQGFAFTLNNKFYTAQDVVINEQHYAYGAAKSENDCMEQCQNMFDCTGYDYVLKGSDQGYCYMFDRSISDLSLAANPDKNTGFLLSRIPDCYNDGKTIACATQYINLI